MSELAHVVRQVVGHALLITAFVFVMMLVVEYLNVATRGVWERRLARRRSEQYLLAGLLGAAPGCLGAFTAVALHAHRLLTVGALVTCMIATSGDEAFVMLAVAPKAGLLLMAILATVGIAAGAATDAVGSRLGLRLRAEGAVVNGDHCDLMVIHEGEGERLFPRWRELVAEWRHCSMARGVLTVALALMLIALLSGALEAGHGPAGHAEHGASEQPAAAHAEQGHGEEGHAEHGQAALAPGAGFERAIAITLVIVIAVGLFIVATAKEHFLQEHFWEHLAKRHVPKVFLWILGTMILLEVVRHLDADEWIRAHQSSRWLLLAVACALALVPESGPHLIFVFLFREGLAPFSVLLASGIVQEGHGMLPLLAHSRRDFLVIKGIKLAIGAALGAGVMLAGY